MYFISPHRLEVYCSARYCMRDEKHKQNTINKDVSNKRDNKHEYFIIIGLLYCTYFIHILCGNWPLSHIILRLILPSGSSNMIQSIFDWTKMNLFLNNIICNFLMCTYTKFKQINFSWKNKNNFVFLQN